MSGRIEQKARRTEALDGAMVATIRQRTGSLTTSRRKHATMRRGNELSLKLTVAEAYVLQAFYQTGGYLIIKAPDKAQEVASATVGLMKTVGSEAFEGLDAKMRELFKQMKATPEK